MFRDALVLELWIDLQFSVILVVNGIFQKIINVL